MCYYFHVVVLTQERLWGPPLVKLALWASVWVHRGAEWLMHLLCGCWPIDLLLDSLLPDLSQVVSSYDLLLTCLDPGDPGIPGNPRVSPSEQRQLRELGAQTEGYMCLMYRELAASASGTVGETLGSSPYRNLSRQVPLQLWPNLSYLNLTSSRWIKCEDF